MEAGAVLEVPFRQLYGLEKGASQLVEREVEGVRMALVEAAEVAWQASMGVSGSHGGVRCGSPSLSGAWGAGQGAALAALDAAQERVERLRAKLAGVRDREDALVAQLRARVAHVAGVADAAAPGGAAPEAWERQRFDRALCEYALHVGAFDVARALTYGEGREPPSAPSAAASPGAVASPGASASPGAAAPPATPRGGGGSPGGGGLSPPPSAGGKEGRGRRNSMDGTRAQPPSGAAAAIRGGAPLQGLSDYENVRGAEEVCEALRRRDAGPALAWCAANRARLRRIGGGAAEALEFSLRAQELAELVRGRRAGEALAHARKHLAAFAEWDPELWQWTMGALAFHPDAVPSVFEAVPAPHPRGAGPDGEVGGGEEGAKGRSLDERLEVYRTWFDGSKWGQLAEAFREGYFAVQGMTSEPLLETYMTLGLCALKTHYPYEIKRGAPGDPLRHPSIRRLAEGLPYAKHVRSKLLCRVTGKLMDDDNPPMVLPNGQCYSRLAVAQGLRRTGQKRPADLPPDHLRCPETGNDFPISSATRAYLT